jgi:hypothetical protein
VPRHAACSCDQLRVTVEGEPLRISICHCLACQRRTGGAFGVQARWDEAGVRIEGITPELSGHRRLSLRLDRRCSLSYLQ